MKILSIICLSFTISACSQRNEDLQELSTLCERDGGLKIYKTVEADGYYDATGRNSSLIHTDYRFFEYCDDSPSKHDFIPQPGCWRLSTVRRDSGLCHEKIDKRIANFVVEPYPEFLKGHCISVNEIAAPTAKYSFDSQLDFWPAKNEASRFGKSTSAILDTVSNEVIGSYINYVYKEHPESTGIDCSDLIEGIPTYKDVKFIEAIIKPALAEKK